MNRTSVRTAALALALCAALISGWTASRESIRKAMSGVKTISCTFIQKKEVKILTKPLVSSGRLYYRAPDSIRWEYAYPVKSVLLVDKGKIRRYIWKDNGFVEDSTARVEAVRIVVGQITRWFSGDFDGGGDFRSDTSGNTMVLVPLNETIRGFINKVIIRFSERQGVISSIEIIEAQGAVSTLAFGDVEINRGLSEGIFDRIQ